MQNRLFHSVLGCLALSVAGCASSAIVTDEDPVDDPGPPANADIDAGAPVPTGPRDASSTNGRDAGRSADGGAVANPATSFDAGESGTGGNDAATPSKDAAVDAKVDAAQPPVDAGAPPLVCSGDTSACNGQCVNLTNDGSNCGSCGHACSATQTCTDSKCDSPAQPTQVPAGCTAKTYQNRSYAFCSQTRSWDDARSSCLGSKMDLVIVSDMAESDFVKGNGDSWIGENDLNKEGTYLAVVPGNAGNNNGANVSFFNWRKDEPSNTQRCDGIDIFVGCLGKKTDEDCLMIYADGSWNDDLCTRSRAYVCESY
ncbi:MAG: hypothetical protein JWN48_5611 [Myxococcaceae bacterium]|nr:hypothetical protein [Myxococcaceae bacterium]